MSKITPSLWYTKEAEEAARFYVSLLPDSRIDSVSGLPADSPAGSAGSVRIVEFTLAGQSFMAMSAGPMDEFNHSISFSIACDDQAEIDRLWKAFLDHGGTEEQCGWIRDRYGVSWQIVPKRLGELMKGSDPASAKRVAEAMLTMVKFDIAALEKAAAG
jgi:predicted 3-demethylubiquinone-9 3-methyltransferase (glyoxalase superfamily)